MRISDWSSDVCSSDLADGGAAPAQAHGGAVGRSGLRQVGGEPVLPVLLRRAVLPPQAGVRPLVDDPLAGPDRGRAARAAAGRDAQRRSEEHTSELQSLMRISYAVFCLKKKKITKK